jgi:hypothetical protein
MQCSLPRHVPACRLVVTTLIMQYILVSAPHLMRYTLLHTQALDPPYASVHCMQPSLLQCSGVGIQRRC